MSKVTRSKANVAATKAIFREWSYQKNGGIDKNSSGLNQEDKDRIMSKCTSTRFFFETKFESKCQLCGRMVGVGVKAMIRPESKTLDKLFCCFKCSAPWRGEELTECTKRLQKEYSQRSQKQQDFDNRVTLDTSGDRDDIYKVLDDIYNNNQ